MKIGEKIKSIRKAKGMTQKEFADIVGLSIATIQGYEQGKYQPKIETIDKIAHALNIDISELTGISIFLENIEKELINTVSFYDYLSSLGYNIVEFSNKNETKIFLRTQNKTVSLNSDDINIIRELEKDTNTNICRTIELMIAAKNNNK